MRATIRAWLILASGSLSLLASTTSPAESFRCGDRLVTESSTAEEILSRCGQPDRIDVSEVEPVVKNLNGTTRKLPPVRTETWTYNREQGAAAMQVVVVDGKVKSLGRAPQP